MEAQAATSTGAATKTLPAGDTVVALDRGRTAERGGVRAGRRDSVRRRALALSDMVAIVGAYLLVWVVDPPPGTLVERAPLLAALPLSELSVLVHLLEPPFANSTTPVPVLAMPADRYLFGQFAPAVVEPLQLVLHA